MKSHEVPGFAWLAMVVGRNGRIAGATPALLSHLGLDRPDQINRFSIDDSSGCPLQGERLPWRRAAKGEAFSEGEIWHCSTGAPISLHVRSCPLEGEGGALLAFDALDHLCDEYVAMVAHDLRNPLQAMMLQLELLLRHHSGESAVQVPIAALRRLSRNGQRLARLVQDLLDSARIEGGRVHLDREPLELPRVVAELVQQLELTLGNHPVQLRVEGEPQVVLADPLRLEQILTNLLENAAKFSSEGSPIEVTMARSNGGARVTVCDRGPGIPPEDLPGLFDRHHQAKRAREKRSGLGLGLYIARGMVDAHGGRLWVERMPKGSAFHVWLPCSPQGLSVAACLGAAQEQDAALPAP